MMRTLLNGGAMSSFSDFSKGARPARPGRPALFLFVLTLLAGLGLVAWRAWIDAEDARALAQARAQAAIASVGLEVSRAVSLLEADGRRSNVSSPNLTKIAASSVAAWPGLKTLAAQNYHYVFFVPPAGRQPALVLATTGKFAFADSVRQGVVVRDLNLQAALLPRHGWINKTRVAVETIVALLAAGLVWLLLHTLRAGHDLEESLAEANRRLEREGAESKQLQEEARKSKDAVTAAHAESSQARLALQQAQQKLADSETHANSATRATKEELETVRARLKESEQLGSELQERLDGAVRSADQLAQARDQELDQVKGALKRAEQQAKEFQSQLAAANRAAQATAATAQARLDSERAAIASLQSRVAESEQTSRANAAKLLEAEVIIQQLRKRLADEETHATGPSPRTSTDAASEAGAPESDDMTELPQPSAVCDVDWMESAPALDQGSPEPQPPPAAPDVELSTTGAESTSPSENSREVPPAPPVVVAEPLSKPPTAKATRSRKSRRDSQMDLFAPSSSAKAMEDRSSGDPPDSPERASQPKPAQAVPAGEPDPTPSPDGPTEAKVAGAKTEPVPAETAAMDRDATEELELPAIEGLTASAGLARAGGNPKVYLKTLRRFAEQRAGDAGQIRDALEQGQPGAAEQIARELAGAAGEAGAIRLETAAQVLAHGIHAPEEPDRLELLWGEVDRCLRDLLAELKPALKPKEEKSSPPAMGRFPRAASDRHPRSTRLSCAKPPTRSCLCLPGRIPERGIA